MKLLVVSDLHLRRGETLALPAELCLDASVIAGDVPEQGHRAVVWAQGAAGIYAAQARATGPLHG
jgi:predicted phosphodiesterase